MAKFKWLKKPGPAEADNKATEGAVTPEPDQVPELVPVEASDPDAKKNVLHQSTTGASTATENMVYPTGARLALVMLSIFVSMFLVALDRLIISTAIPQITDDFHSYTDIGWYGSAFLLATCAFQLLFGKLYTFYSIKYVFIATILLFEVGSALCGAAPNSIAFILGRTIAGVGSAGIFSGAVTIIVYALPLHKRPKYQGLFGAVFGLASVAGPLLGGVFTSKVSWRWCFYINLPFGAVAIAIIFFLLDLPDRGTSKMSGKSKLAQLDVVGTSVFIPGTICLLLALQWGGLDFAWSNWRIVLCLVLGGVLLVLFVVIQILMPKTATVPPRIFKNRSIYSAFFAVVCIGSQMMIFVYFLPIWFQAIKGVSAVDSGIRLLPLVLSMVIASILTGILVSKVGYYTPFMLWGIVIMSIGAGLLTTLQLDTDQPKWIGYQIVYGWGLGSTFQAPNIAAQTAVPMRDSPVAVSLMFFGQLLGGAIFISVGQNVLNNALLESLAQIPGFDPSILLDAGATTLVSQLPPNLVVPVLTAYNEALRKVFRVGLILSCLTIIGALGMEWLSVKKNLHKEKDAEAPGAAGGDVDVADTDGATEVVDDVDGKVKPPTPTENGVGSEKRNVANGPSAEGTSAKEDEHKDKAAEKDTKG